MPTMTGFRHAQVSKALVFATAGASILSQAARASRRTQLFSAALTNAFVFRSPAELLFGTLLIYCFRVLERELGPNKFGTFAAISISLAAAMQWAAQHSGLGLPPCPSGPYGLIFACFVQYYFQLFLYLMGLQLLMSAGWASLLAGATGLVAGLIYRLNVLGIKRLRCPVFVQRLFANTLGALLGSDGPPGPLTSNTGSRVAAARRGRHATATTAAVAGSAGSVPSAPHLPVPSREAVEQLVSMGFGEADSIRALQLTNNDLQQAIGLLLNS